MVIKNETKKTILANNAIQAKTFKQKAFGLLLSKNPQTMIFQTGLGIHTFFMKYAIDVVILDNQNAVAVLKENLKPNHIFVWNPKYTTVIELPPRTIKKTHTQISDTISF